MISAVRASQSFRYSSVVLATTTYNADIFPTMRDFIVRLAERNFQNRKIGFIENGSWAPVSGRIMRAMLEEMKNIEIVDTVVTIKSRMKKTDIASLEQLADAIRPYGKRVLLYGVQGIDVAFPQCSQPME